MADATSPLAQAQQLLKRGLISQAQYGILLTKLAPPAQPQPVGATDPYAMYAGDPAAIAKMQQLSQGRPLNDEERKFGATAYGQDFQKRQEAMQNSQPGPFTPQSFLDERRATQADKENNMLFDGRWKEIGI